MKINSVQKTVATVALAALLTAPAFSQTSSPHQTAAAATPADLAEQLAALQLKVQHLEHQLQSDSTAAPRSGMKMSGKKAMPGGMAGNDPASINMSDRGSGSMKMGMKEMEMDMEMGMNKMSKGGGGMSGMKMGGMDMMGKGMDMMGMMKGKGGMAGMAMQSALPGFPGASHIYHIGATDFFLDHGEHIQLTIEQQAALARIKEKSALEQATAERNIEEIEQQLWELTGADEPDVKSIESKIEASEKLRGVQRLAFIRAVGDAAKLLTDEQVKLLTGMAQDPPLPAHSNH